MERTILETERLILREFTLADVEAFYRLGNDPDIIRYTSDPGLRDVDHARETLMTRPLADYAKYGYGRWACVWKATGQVIGFAGLKYLDDWDAVDLGYRLLPGYWGQGVATEAGRAVVSFGFEQLGLTTIIGLVDPANPASIRVLEKLGFQYIGAIVFRGDPCRRYELHRVPSNTNTPS